jgi:type VI secretion system protein ImpH
METDERPPSNALIRRLLERPHGFNLFQAISLLERTQPHLPAVGTRGDDPSAVRITSVVSLGFPGSDVSKVTFSQQPQAAYRLSTGVMSLAGAHGPLPVPFTEMVIARTAAKDFATADFLDIFNNRFLAFLYRGRKKHNMGLSWEPPQLSAVAACLDYLSALGLKAGLHARSGEVTWLRHAGLLAGSPRSMTGLLTLITDRFGLVADGYQFRGDWRDLEPRDVVRLGALRGGPHLGVNAMLGTRVWDQSSGITIAVHQLSMNRFNDLLPGGLIHALFAWVVRRYLQQDVTVELVLSLDVAAHRPFALGSENPTKLGWTSWLTGVAAPLKSLKPAKFTLQPLLDDSGGN